MFEILSAATHQQQTVTDNSTGMYKASSVINLILCLLVQYFHFCTTMLLPGFKTVNSDAKVFLILLSSIVFHTSVYIIGKYTVRHPSTSSDYAVTNEP
jgi:uncharacterized BrkB/YihY/UPF0761 family membrane protein